MLEDLGYLVALSISNYTGWTMLPYVSYDSAAGCARLPVCPQLLAELVERAAGPLLLHANNMHGRLLADPLPLGDTPDLFDDL
jgi:hypothetical protein